MAKQDNFLKYKLLIEQSNISPAEKEELLNYFDQEIHKIIKRQIYDHNRIHTKDNTYLKNLIYSILPPPGYCVTFKQLIAATGLTYGEVKYRIDDLVKEGKVIRHRIREGTKRPMAYEKVELQSQEEASVPPLNGLGGIASSSNS